MYEMYSGGDTQRDEGKQISKVVSLVSWSELNDKLDVKLFYGNLNETWNNSTLGRLSLWESQQRLKIKFFFFFAFRVSDALEFCADEKTI